MKNVVKDIRFWILVFFAIRLVGICDPPLEILHNWRQTLGTMVARNYLEIDNNVFYPRVDMAGEKTGITGMEFPLLNYLIYLVAEAFGYQHWYGRLINLVISSFGMWFFYKLIRKYFNMRVAFNSTIVLLASVWFSYSRKIMPDTFSMSLIICSLYFGTNYLEEKKNSAGNLVAYVLLLILGSLSKLPAVFVLVLFGIHFMDNRILLSRKFILAAVSLAGLLITSAWYFYWEPHLVKTYEFFHFFMGVSPGAGLSELWATANETAEKFYFVALKFSGFVFFMWGLIHSIIKKDKVVLVVFLLTFLSFSLIMIKSGRTFSHHAYYIIPFAPVMAFVAGYGLDKIKNSRLAIVLLCIVVFEGIGNQIHDFRISPQDTFVARLESELDEVIERDDLIVINSPYNPTPMYFTHRKGWLLPNEQIQDAEHIAAMKENGLKYILILKKRFGKEIELPNMQRLLETEDYCLYKP